MKISKFLFLVLAAGILSAAARADKIDPTITIKKGGHSPITKHGSTENDPIIVGDGLGLLDFLYEGPATNILYVEVVPGPNDVGGKIFQNEVFNCVPGLAASCKMVGEGEDSAGGGDDALAVEFRFKGPKGGLLFNPYDQNGNLTGFDISVGEVPEPTTVLMLGLGLAGLMLLGKKRLNFAAIQS